MPFYHLLHETWHEPEKTNSRCAVIRISQPVPDLISALKVLVQGELWGLLSPITWVFSAQTPVPEKRIKATFELVLTRAFWNLQPRKVTILSSLRKPELTAQPWDLEEACWNREFLFLSQGTTCHDSSLLVFTNTLLKEVGLALQGDHLHPKSLGSENDPTQTACCGCNIIPTGNCPRPSDLLTQLSKETWSLWHEPWRQKKTDMLFQMASL